jgi:hypothetical protein
VSPLEYDAEKAGTVTLGDVSRMLPDYSSSAPSSSSSDTESVGGEEGEEIEVSSLHRASVQIFSLLEPAHTRPASVRDAGDIV